MKPQLVYHFSEDPNIRQFAPHVPKTQPESEPRVWAIDAEHAPLYWFPRDCPRVTFWAGPDTHPDAAVRWLGATASRRVHAIESSWLERMRTVTVFAYRFASDEFESYPGADGHWVSRETVAPLDVEPLGDLLELHARAEIELRITPSLWPLSDEIPGSGLRFSLVRMRNAQPRR